MTDARTDAARFDEDLDLYSEDLKSIDVDPTPDALSAAGSSTHSSFSSVGSVSTATCAATTGTFGTASSW